MTLLSKLQELTQQAIAKSELDRAMRASESVEHLSQAEILAEQIIAQIPDECASKAKVGRKHAIIMGLKYNQDYSDYHGDILEAQQLKGAAAIVWQKLIDEGLKPKIEYWHNAEEITSGFNIIAEWT